MMRRAVEILFCTATLVAACGRQAPIGAEGMELARAAPPAQWSGSPPLADIPGPVDQNVAAVANPYASDPRATERGRRLYEEMNCSYCHGPDLGGLIGPSLIDDYWRYGGASLEIYSSLEQGRPKGMPAWGSVLPPTDLWALTAYIQSRKTDQRSAQRRVGHAASAP